MSNFRNFGENEAVAIGIIIVAVIVLLITFALWVMVLVFLSNTFKRIPAKHRQMEPGQVFLLLIPCFNFVWMFFVFQKLPRSLQSYFAEKGRADVGDCGESLGLIVCIGNVANIGLGFIPFLGLLTAIAVLVIEIVFLLKINELRKQIPLSESQQPAYK